MTRRLVGTLLLVAAPGVSAQASLSGRVIADDDPVAGAVVYLVPRGRPAVAPTPITAVIDQRNLRFTPAMLVVTPGSSVDFTNSDSLLHNVFSPTGPSGPFDLGTYQIGERRRQVFSGTGTHVILCHVHPEMVAWVVVVPTSWHATTDADGEFVLPDIPLGAWDVVVAHRRRHQPHGSLTISTPGERVRRTLSLSRRGPPI